MGVPYSKAYSFDVVAGDDVALEIPAPPRGTLTRLIVKQVDGTYDGFEFDVLDRQDAANSLYSQVSCNPGDELLDPDMYKIMATQVVAPASQGVELFNLVIPYENKDSLCDGTHAAKRPRLWINLRPPGSGAKTFQVAISVTSELD